MKLSNGMVFIFLKKLKIKFEMSADGRGRTAFSGGCSDESISRFHIAVGKVCYGMHGRIKLDDLFFRRFGLFVVLCSFRYGPLVEHLGGSIVRHIKNCPN